MIGELLQAFGYAALVLILFLDGSGVPWPTEATLVAAGAFAHRGDMSLLLLGASALGGALLGSSLSYYLGRRMGPALLQRIAHFFHLSPQHLAKVDEWFTRYGKKAVFFGRFVPFVRCFTGYPAGVARMPFGEYLLFSALGYGGYITLTLGVGLGGSFLGRWLYDLEVALWVAVPLVLAFAWFKWVRRWVQARRGKA